MPTLRSLALCLSALVLGLLATTALNAAPTIEHNEIKLTSSISFINTTASLTDESTPALAELKDFLKNKPALTLIRIEGHVSSAHASHSQALSEARALSLARWLSQHDIDCARLLPVGFGDTKPVVASDAPDSATANTRITLVIASLRGRAIGGLPPAGGGQVAGDACAPAP